MSDTQKIGLEKSFQDDGLDSAQIQEYANTTFEQFDYATTSTESVGIPKLNTRIIQLPTSYANIFISVLALSSIQPYRQTRINDEIGDVVQFGNLQLNRKIELQSIDSSSNLIYDTNESLLVYTKIINFDNIINDYFDVTLETLSSQTFEDVTESIESSVAFGENIFVNITIPINSIDSEVIFGTSVLNQSLTFDSVISTISFGNFTQLNMSIEDAPFPSIESELQFGNPQFNFKLYTESFTTINTFETNHKLSFKVYSNSIETEATFGNFTQLNMSIEDVPFPSIESTLVIPAPNVIKVIGPLSIGSTENVGISSFVDNIHRILVFKDDNISKIGENDAAVIAGGIRLNPASTSSNTASSGSSQLPEAPVGFLSINISGIDYKIPYYNS